VPKHRPVTYPYRPCERASKRANATSAGHPEVGLSELCVATLDFGPKPLAVWYRIAKPFRLHVSCGGQIAGLLFSLVSIACGPKNPHGKQLTRQHGTFQPLDTRVPRHYVRMPVRRAAREAGFGRICVGQLFSTVCAESGSVSRCGGNSGEHTRKRKRAHCNAMQCVTASCPSDLVDRVSTHSGCNWRSNGCFP
jgi:hypothetical protein